MVGDWSRMRLSEAAEFQEGPGILAVDFRDEGTPLLRLRNIEGAFVDLKGCNYLDPQRVAQKWSHFRLLTGDLLISTSASLGRVSEVTELAEGSIGYTGIIRFRPRIHVSRDYLRVFLSSREFLDQADAMAAGSVIRHFGPSHLREMWIHIPPPRLQALIGELGRALDDKIELNRWMAETLEAMARALFKSWFVDFDPVHARAESHPTGLPDDLAALFPDSFGDDGLPDTWSNRSISALGTFLNGLALQKYPAGDDESSLPVIKIAELRAGPTSKSDRANASLPSDYVVEDGDHLFSWSGSLTHCRWSYGRGALNQHLFKVTARSCPSWFLYQAVDHFLPKFKAIASDKAVTMGHIQRRHLDEAIIALPEATLMNAADHVLGPIYDRVLALALQCRTLATLRDTLLPKLISGELRIADAEQRVAAA